MRLMGGIAEGAGAAVQALLLAALALLLWFPANLNAISDAMVAILKIVAVLLAGELRRIYGYAVMFRTEGLLADLQRPNRDTTSHQGQVEWTKIPNVVQIMRRYI